MEVSVSYFWFELAVFLSCFYKRPFYTNILQILQTPLKEADPEISSILGNEIKRQKNSIVLIASEVV